MPRQSPPSPPTMPNPAPPLPADFWSRLGPLTEQIHHDLELKYLALHLAQRRRDARALRRLYLRARGAYGPPH